MSVSRALDDYRDFIQRSKAEFAVAKHTYVATRSGWFSDRTECYLAAGRPALVQDTGWTASPAAWRGAAGVLSEARRSPESIASTAATSRRPAAPGKSPAIISMRPEC